MIFYVIYKLFARYIPLSSFIYDSQFRKDAIYEVFREFLNSLINRFDTGTGLQITFTIRN